MKEIVLKTRKYSSRMRTARFCSSGVGSRYTLTPKKPYLQILYPLDTLHPRYPTPPERTWDQISPTSVNKLTDTCENITFPQLLLRAVISINLKCDNFNSFWPNKQSSKKGNSV